MTTNPYYCIREAPAFSANHLLSFPPPVTSHTRLHIPSSQLMSALKEAEEVWSVVVVVVVVVSHVWGRTDVCGSSFTVSSLTCMP